MAGALAQQPTPTSTHICSQYPTTPPGGRLISEGCIQGGAGRAPDDRGGNQLTKSGNAKTNSYHAYKTAKPSKDFVINQNLYVNKDNNTSNQGRKVNYNRDNFNGGATSSLTINAGGDDVTRPPTLSVHFIIKT